MSNPNRRLLPKGPPRPAKPSPWSASTTQLPARKEEFIMNKSNEKEEEIAVVQFSNSLPQPFLDTSIIEKRIQAEKQREAEEQRKKERELERERRIRESGR